MLKKTVTANLHLKELDEVEQTEDTVEKLAELKKQIKKIKSSLEQPTEQQENLDEGKSDKAN